MVCKIDTYIDISFQGTISILSHNNVMVLKQDSLSLHFICKISSINPRNYVNCSANHDIIM